MRVWDSQLLEGNEAEERGCTEMRRITELSMATLNASTWGGVQGVGCWVLGVGCEVQGVECGVWGVGFRV